MSVNLKPLTNTGDPITAPDGTVLASTDVTFQLVALSNKKPIAVFDATTGELISAEPVSVTTSAAGEFTTSLWPNNRGDAPTCYKVTVDTEYIKPFYIVVQENAENSLLTAKGLYQFGSGSTSVMLVAGEQGDSAYAVAVAGGFTGTEAEWLASLRGAVGADGDSAYAVAVAGGFTGTEAEWLASLHGADGADGDSAYAVAVAGGFTGTEAEWLASLHGADGADGDSAYAVAVAGGFTGTEAEWLASLHGADGINSFYKIDFVSSCFTKTAAATISVKAGTSVLVNATTVSFATQTAVTMPSHTIGTDYCIYACADGSIRADANTTAPAGYDTANSRKIGGYHYGRIRNSLTVTDVATEIVPRSLWDLTYRPKCNPAGMVDVYGNGSLWADIYQAAVDSAITLTNGVITAGSCKSIYNGTPLTGTEGLHGYNFIELAKNSGKRLLTHSEWLAVAHGSPQGNDGDNLNAWSATTNTARTGTGQVARAVSFCGATDCVGNLWEWLDEWSNDYSTAVSANWYNPMTGQNVGQQYLYNSTGLRMYLAGGYWTNGVFAGSRALLVIVYPWIVSTYFGSRFACDGL